MKRSVNSAEINKNDATIGFEYGDVKYVFSDGNILAVKGGQLLRRNRLSILQEGLLIHIEDYRQR